MKELNKGLNVNLDMPRQVEFNRKKNLYQDKQLEIIGSKLNALLELSPAGYLPKVFYGLTRGVHTFRFTKGEVINIHGIIGAPGDMFELIDISTHLPHVPAIAILGEGNQITIELKGDYQTQVETMKLVNMNSGTHTMAALGEYLTYQPASFLGDIDANENRNKQITVIRDMETNTYNVLYVSMDINNDGDYNWYNLISLVNGLNGHSILGVSIENFADTINEAKIGDILLSGQSFTYNSINYEIGDLKVITGLYPLVVESIGNIRGQVGATGLKGDTGNDGADGTTPHIQENYWYIGEVNTGIKALGVDGVDGSDGSSFTMESGLYSTIDNFGETGNIGPDGEILKELPELPSNNVEGFAYIVFDPLTTPLFPNYHLYWASNGDSEWSIIKNYNGRPGKDGVDGITPHIENGKWYLGDVNTGINATGPTGAKGDRGEQGIEGPQGPKGEDGFDGDDGDTPYILNDKWWIGDLNTNVNATGPQGPLPSLTSIIDLIYPIGSIYISTVNTNPKILFGGTWEQITADAYLKIVTSNAGTLGGVSDHKISIANMPSHNHSSPHGDFISDNTHSGIIAGSDIWVGRQAHSTTTSTGGGEAYYPYYYGIYVWKRIADK